jgi:hypothetical protein
MLEPLAGLIGAVAAAIAALLVEWLRSDAKLRSNPRTVEELSSCITLLESWSKAYASVLALPDGAGKKPALDYAIAIVSQASEKLAAAAEARTLSNVAQRSESVVVRVLDFLRIRAPTVRTVWIPLVLYFASVAMAIRIASVQVSITSPGFLVAAAAAVLFWLVCWAMEHWLRTAVR